MESVLMKEIVHQEQIKLVQWLIDIILGVHWLEHLYIKPLRNALKNVDVMRIVFILHMMMMLEVDHYVNYIKHFVKLVHIHQIKHMHKKLHVRLKCVQMKLPKLVL